MWALWVVAMSCITAPTHCLPIDTVWGDGVPDPFGGEGWCIGTPLDRWAGDDAYATTVVTNRATLAAQCGDFGGRLVVTPDESYENSVLATIVSSTPYDFRGMDVAFRITPMEGDGDQFGYAMLGGAGSTNDLYVRIEYDSGQDRIDFFLIAGATDEYVRVNSYEPDGAHEWWRFQHDPDTEVFTLSTSPSCGNWTAQLSGTVTNDYLRRAWWEITWQLDVFGLGGGPFTGTGPGTLGQMWACEPAVASES